MGQLRCSVTLQKPLNSFTACALSVFVLLSLIYSIDDLHKFTIFYAASLMPSLPESARPPVYTNIRESEMNLPQHNLALPYPEGRRGRYVLFSNSRTHLSGWNNKLNDMYASAKFIFFGLARANLC
jgi:hypothetical protein